LDSDVADEPGNAPPAGKVVATSVGTALGLEALQAAPSRTRVLVPSSSRAIFMPASCSSGDLRAASR
jgi:hypothetical protein